jgi:hypothetical protein
MIQSIVQHFPLVVFVLGLSLGITIAVSAITLWLMHTEELEPIQKQDQQLASWASLRDRYHDDQFPPP